MFLNNPATYVSLANFKAMPLDYDISGYTDLQLTGMLVRASAKADAMMRRSLQAQEKTIRYLGDGTNRLELREAPLLYVKRVQIVFPGTTGPFIPIDQLLIDFGSGSLFEYTPMMFNGTIGYFSRFPEGIPVDVTLASGFGYTYSAPAYSTQDGSGSGLPAGTYNLALTTQTMSGQTAAVVRQVTTASGSILVTVNPVLGAYLYDAYVSSAANNTTLNGATAIGAISFALNAVGTIAVGDVLLVDSGSVAEYLTVAAVNAGAKTITTSTGAVYAHANGAAVIERPTLVAQSPFTAYGNTNLQLTINSLQPQNGLWADPLPLIDTSAPPQPAAFDEAIRLLVLSTMYEQNNLANRGVYTEESGRKRISWKSTEGNSAKGVPLLEQQAAVLLKPYSLQAIF